MILLTEIIAGNGAAAEATTVAEETDILMFAVTEVMAGVGQEAETMGVATEATELITATIGGTQLDVNTVGAGGGSRLFFRSGMFYVGPESSGAHPGPVCYRKNGYLTITDANLLLGRIEPSMFPHIFGENADQPFDVQATTFAFK